LNPGFRQGFGHGRDLDRGHDREEADYGKSLRDGPHASGASHQRIAALSLFTTQSTSADLEKIRAQIKRSQPAPIDFNIGNSATVIDPDGAGPFFETPIALPLPEALNYIP